MHILYAILFILPTLFYPLITTYTCPNISQFYINCSNSSTFNQSLDFCLQHGMTLLDLTSAGIGLNLNETLQSINCTSQFWYINGNQTSLAVTGLSTGGVICSITSLLGLYCISTPIVQAATVCTRTNQIEIQQKCPNNNPNQRYDLKEFTFIRKIVYANILNNFPSRSLTECNRICSRTSQCIGTNYQQRNCTLYT